MLQRLDGTGWSSVMTEWSRQCDGYEENLEDFATASLPLLEELALGAFPNAGVFGVFDAASCTALCQANSTFLPGYTGKVLRIRHIVLSPTFDFSSNVSLEDYERALVSVFVGALKVAQGDLPSKHVKFHLRSPLERQLGASFTEAMQQQDHFSLVDMRGAWIYLSQTAT